MKDLFIQYYFRVYVHKVSYKLVTKFQDKTPPLQIQTSCQILTGD